MEEREEEYQQQETPFLPPQYGYDATGVESSLAYQLDTDKLIVKLKEIFLGLVSQINPKTNLEELIPGKNKKPLMTESGWNIVEPVLRGYLDKLFPLSDLDQQTIEFMTLGLEYDLRNLITINFLQGNEWKIHNLSTASTIKNIVCNQVFATLSKAKNRGYQNFLKTVQRIQEVQAFRGSLGPNNEPVGRQGGGGMMSKIPGIGRLFR